MDLLVVEPLPEEVLAWLSARQTVHYAPHWAQDRAALRLALRHVRGLILPDSVPVDARLLRLAPGLRVIGRVAGGMEQIDHEACERVGVQVVRAEQATAQAEAEFALAAILQMLRRVPVPDADGVPVGREVQGLCLGLVGITPAVVPLARLFNGLGATLVGYDPALRVDDAGWQQVCVRPLALADVFAAADALCVMLPGFSRYAGLIGERFIQHSRRHQVLLSLSDAGLFDEAALAQGLRQRAPGAVWLDCAPPGLLEPGRPLHGVRHQVQTTPRLASTTRESRLRSAWEVARKVDRLLEASAPNPQQGAADADAFSGEAEEQPAQPISSLAAPLERDTGLNPAPPAFRARA